MNILGISAFYHDSGVALLVNGEIIAAVQEERFSRKKHDEQFPHHGIRYCLSEAGLGLDDIDYIAFYDKPFIKFERLLETYIAEAPKGLKSFMMAIPVWLRDKLFLKETLAREFRDLYAEMHPEVADKQLKKVKQSLSDKLMFGEHHQSHAASAFFPSPYPPVSA